MNGYQVLVVESGDDPQETMQRLLAQREWVESVMKTVSGTMDSLNPPLQCLVLEMKLPEGERMGRVRLVGEPNVTDRAVRPGFPNRPVRLALVKGMDPNTLFRTPIDFEEACRACEADTALWTDGDVSTIDERGALANDS